MATSSPAISVNGNSAGDKVEVLPGSSVTATIADITGIRTVTWDVYKKDDLSSFDSFSLAQSGAVGQTVTFTWPASGGLDDNGFGTAIVLRSIINGAVGSRGIYDLNETTGTVKIHARTSGGQEVITVGEEMESHPVFGYAPLINDLIRNGGAQGPVGPAAEPVLINVKDYGAMGDGTTDDLASIQDAIDACEVIAASLGVQPTLFFPAGTYRIVVTEDIPFASGLEPAGTLICQESITFAGDGRDASVLFVEPDTYPSNPIYDYHGVIVEKTKNFTIREMSMVCATPVTDSGGTALDPDADPSFGHGPASAIFHKGGASSYASGQDFKIEVYNCLFNGPRGGFYTNVYRNSGDGRLEAHSNIFNVNAVGLTAFCGGGTYKNIVTPERTYDVEVFSYNNKYHSWGHNHSIYRHPAVAIKSVGDYHGPSLEYPDAHPLGAYYNSGQNAFTDARPPKYVTIEAATIIGDKDYAIRQHQARVLEDTDSWLESRALTTSAQSSVTPDGSLYDTGDYYEPMRVVVEFSNSPDLGASNVTIYGYEANYYNPGIETSEVIAVNPGDANKFYGKTLWARVVRIDLPATNSNTGNVTIGNADGPLRVWNVNGCTFLGVGKVCEVKGPLNMVGCTADSYEGLPTSRGLYFASNGAFTEINVSGCTFRTAGPAFECNHAEVTDGARVSFSDCVFEKIAGYDAGSGQSIINNEATSSSADSADVETTFSRCSFRVPGENDHVMLSNNSAKFYGCKFFGAFRSTVACLTNIPTPGERNSVWHFSDCEAEDGVKVVSMGNATGLGLTLRGWNNQFWRESDTVSIPAYADGGIGQMVPMEGIYPDALVPNTDFAGGYNLTPQGWNANTWLVSGSNVIRNIMHDANNRAIRGTIYFFGNSGWSFDGGSAYNVIPISSSVRDTGVVYGFQYVPSEGKWYEHS